MRGIPVIIIGMVTLLVPAAAGAATALSPVGGARVTTSHPTFRWSLNGGDTVGMLVVSKAQRTTPAGEFYDEDQEQVEFPGDTATAHASSEPIPAGTYWWNLSWMSAAFNDYYTPPEQFTIAPSFLNGRFGQFHWYQYVEDDFTVSWWSNTRTVYVKCRVYYRGRIIGRDSERITYPTIAGRNSMYCEPKVRSKYDGKRVKLAAIVSGGGGQRTFTRRVRWR